MSRYVLDIFSVLRMLDRNDMNIHHNLSDNPDVLKELEKNAGWMLPLWMSSSEVDRDHRALILNFVEKANLVWESTHGHPILQLRLLAACGLGRPTRHKFYKKPSATEAKGLTELLIQTTPDINPDEIDMWVRHNNEEDVRELAESCGYQAKDIEKLLTEFRRIK